MHKYEAFYQNLMKLVGDRGFLHIEKKPYMPLLVQTLEDEPLISLCQYSTRHGQLVRNPEVIFLTQDNTAKPVYIANDFSGVEEATIKPFFADVKFKPRLQKFLDGFCSSWWKQLEEQGFFHLVKSLGLRNTMENRPGHSVPDLDCGPDLGP